MDVILEISTESLLQVIRQKFADQGVAPPIQFNFGELMALNSIAITELQLNAIGLHSQPWNRPVLGPTLDAFTFIPFQQVRGRITVVLSFASLSHLRAHRPSDPPASISPSTFTLWVFFEPVVRTTGSGVTLSIDVQELQMPLFAGMEDDNIRALLSNATDALRAATRGLDIALPVSVLSPLLAGAGTVLNAAVVVERAFTAAGDPRPTAAATFLQVGIQASRPEWVALSELQRASLIIRKSDDLRAFHQRPVSHRRRADFAIFVSDETIVATSREILRSAVNSAPDRIRLSGEIAGSWIAPADAVSQGNVVLRFSATLLNACGTGHDLAADVTARLRFAVLFPDRIQTGIVLDYSADTWALAGCALEIGGIGAFAGLVIGGVIGGWVGALVGAIAGFLIGFVGVLLYAAFYRAELGHLPSGCSEDPHHDVQCIFSLPPPGADPILQALRLLQAEIETSGMSILSSLGFPPAGVPPRLEAAVFEQLHWHRSGSRWVMAGRIYFTNAGGGALIIGSAMAIGDGAGLYAGRISYPGMRLLSRAPAFIDIEVPRAEVEDARSAGTLFAPEVLIFSTSGARVVRLSGVPEPLTDDAIQLSDYLESLQFEIQRLGRDYALIATPFPPVPDPRTFQIASAAALFQAVLRSATPKDRWALATSTGAILSAAAIDENGNAWLSSVTSADPGNVQIVQLPPNPDSDTSEAARKLIENAAAFKQDVEQTLRSVLQGAFVPKIGDPLSETPLQLDPVMSVGLESPAILGKIDVDRLRTAVQQLADKYGRKAANYTVQMRSSLLAETSLLPCQQIQELRPALSEDRPVLAAIIDGVPFQLAIDGSGQPSIRDDVGAQAKTDSNLGGIASLPSGFIRHASYLVGQVSKAQDQPALGLSVLALVAQAQ